MNRRARARARPRAAGISLAGQAALNVTLLVLAGLLFQSLRNGLDREPGFDVSGSPPAEVAMSAQGFGGGGAARFTLAEGMLGLIRLEAEQTHPSRLQVAIARVSVSMTELRSRPNYGDAVIRCDMSA